MPTGQATGTTLDLSLQEAFQRALKYNLGEIESSQNTRAAHAVRLRSLNALLPNLSARLSGTVQQLDLPSEGLTLLHSPGSTSRRRWDPSAIADARGYLSQEIFNWSDIKNWKSASEGEKASQYTYKSDRNLVVFTTGNAYLLVISDMATVDSVRAQVKTAQTLVQNDVDLNKHGLIASIDLLRAQVEFQTQQQRLIAAENQVADRQAHAGAGDRTAERPGIPVDRLGSLRVAGWHYPGAGAPAGHIQQDPTISAPRRRCERRSWPARPSPRKIIPRLSTDTNYGDIGSPNFGTLAWHARFRRHPERSHLPREPGAGR